MADPNPELGSGSESPEELELEQADPVVPPADPVDPADLNAQGVDPLDDIKDEGARAEAKKHRAIARRTGKPPESPKPEAPKPAGDALTRADFYRINERKAVAAVTADAEVKANWSEISSLYVPRRGKDTPEDISEDIKDAIILFNGRHSGTVVDDSKRDLTVTPTPKAGGGPIVKNDPKLPALPNFHTTIKPTEWYPKNP